MAIVIESVSTDTTYNSNDCVIAKPSGLAVGDLMIAIISMNEIYYLIADRLITSLGWTQYRQDDTQETSVTVLYKVATSGDVSASNFTFTTVQTGLEKAGIIYRLSGASTNPTIQVATGTVDGSTDSNSITLTPTSTSSAVILYTHTGDNGGRTTTVSTRSITGSPTFTERIDVQDTGGSAVSFSCADTTISNQTTITNMTVTSASGVDVGICVLLVVGARVDVTGTNALLQGTPVFFTESAVQVGGTGTNALLQGTPVFFEEDSKVSYPRNWVDSKKNTTTWVDEKQNE